MITGSPPAVVVAGRFIVAHTIADGYPAIVSISATVAANYAPSKRQGKYYDQS